jgi:uncharacterized protein (DUF342 family)
MQKAKHLVAGLGLALLAGGAGVASATTADEAQAKMEKAQEAVAKVRTQTNDWGLWKSTLKILGNAKNSLEQGDHAAAVEGAEEAIFQAEQGMKQYKQEKDEWSKAFQAATSNGNIDEEAWIAGQG